MPQDDVHETGALGADFTPASSAVMLQADAMVLDLEKFFVEREQLSGVQLPLGAKLMLRMSEDFFAMAKHGESASLRLDSVALHFPVKRGPMNAEDLRRLLFISMRLDKRLEDGLFFAFEEVQ